MLSHRQNNLLVGTTPGYAGSWDVYAFPVGARIASASAGSTLTVEPGHSVVANDKGLIFKTDSSTVFTAAVASVTATTIVFSPETYSVVKGDLFVNLGADTGMASAKLDASRMKIWEESDPAQTPWPDSKVTTDATGNYEYYYKGSGAHWELILDNTGVVRSVISGWNDSGVVNVFDFGAAGDGTTVDDEALDAALLVGGVCYAPAGTYLISTTKSILTQSTLYGDGMGHTIFKLADSNAAANSINLFQTAASGVDCHCRDFTIDGNLTNQTWANNSTYGLQVRSTNSTVTRVETHDCDDNGMGVPVNAGEVSFDQCYSHGNAKKGLHSGDVNRIKITNSYFYDNGVTIADAGIGMHQGMQETVVTGNQCWGNGTTGIEVGDSLGTAASNSRQCVVANNICNTNTTVGIHIYADDTTNDDTLHNTVVSGNRCRGNSHGMQVIACRGVAVNGNVLESNTNQGLWIYDSDLITVSGNIFYGNGSPGMLVSGGASGLTARVTSNDCVVHGNCFYDLETSPTQVIGLQLNSTAHTCQVYGNRINDVTAVSIRNFGDSSNGHQIFGNMGNGTMEGQVDEFATTAVSFTSTDATPSVAGKTIFKTAGTTAITDFDDGVVGQVITILATDSISITHGTPIQLAGAVPYAMTVGDTLVLAMFDDQVWVEITRTVI